MGSNGEYFISETLSKKRIFTQNQYKRIIRALRAPKSPRVTQFIEIVVAQAYKNKKIISFKKKSSYDMANKLAENVWKGLSKKISGSSENSELKKHADELYGVIWEGIE